MTDVEKKLRQIQQSYIENLPVKQKRIYELWGEIKSANFSQDSTTQQEEFYSLVHGISGSGATFGFNQLTNTAKPLENLFTQLQTNVLPAQEHIEQVETFISILDEAVQNTAHHTGEFNTENFSYTKEIRKHQLSKVVYILDDDLLQTDSISAQLTDKDYQTVMFSGFDELNKAMNNRAPLALIIDSAYLLDSHHADKLDSIRLNHANTSIICISSNSDMSTRVDALRAGANFFITKPLNNSSIVNALETLVEDEQASVHRVLIIDDDKILASLYATILERANIQAEIVSDPTQSLERINIFKPELILLDIYMQPINGFEVAKLIRQIPELDITSIIFMSTEQEIQRQLMAIDYVGDFLKKPIWPEHLITTVISKCRHARKLIQTQNKLHNTLREYEFQKLAMDQHSITSITDANGDITYVNHMFCESSGYSEEELIGKNHRIIKSGEHDAVFYSKLWEIISQGKVWQGEIKNRTKNGNHSWVESTIVPFLDNNGIPYQYVSVRTDITKIKNAEQEQIYRHQRLQAQNTSLAILTNKEKLFLENKITAYKKISELVSATLNIDRTSIWFFNDKKDTLACEYSYNSDISTSDITCSLDATSFPVFLSTLTNERIVVASDATTNPLTRELSNHYLLPTGIKSVLSAGIYYEGDCIGAICCESIKKIRTWWPEDKNYITTIADYIALLTEQWERQVIQDQLVIAKEKSENANKAKSAFLSRMSHELRTPLNAIIGFSQLINLKPENLSTDQQDSIDEILNAGRHLLGLINEILDLSAIESGKMQIAKEIVNLHSTIHECIQLISPLALKKSIRIINNISDDANIICCGDRTKVKQILINLLSNAIKYNANNGEIHISSNSDDTMISVIIKDTGYGIPEAQMKTLFQPFERSDSEHHHIEGTGIGLAISKNLVELMGGCIESESIVGTGSEFRIKLPKYNSDKTC